MVELDDLVRVFGRGEGAARVLDGVSLFSPEGSFAATTRSTSWRRERQVLELMAAGRSNRGIAEALVVTPHAVEKHVTSLFSKLGVSGVAEDHRRVPAVLSFLRGWGERQLRGQARPTSPRAVDLEPAVERAQAVLEAPQAAAARRVARPAPSSLTTSTSSSPARRTSSRAKLAPAC